MLHVPGALQKDLCRDWMSDPKLRANEMLTTLPSTGFRSPVVYRYGLERNAPKKKKLNIQIQLDLRANDYCYYYKVDMISLLIFSNSPLLSKQIFLKVYPVL